MSKASIKKPEDMLVVSSRFQAEELKHQRELKRIELAHERRAKTVAQFFDNAASIVAWAGAAAVAVIVAITAPSCLERQDSLVDTCIREGTSAKECSCAYRNLDRTGCVE